MTGFLHRGRRYVQTAAAVVMLGAAFAAFSATASEAGSSSFQLRGTFQNISNFSCPASPIGTCSSFNSIGVIHGSGVVVVDGFFPPPSPSGLSNAMTTIHTNRGDLMCSDLAIFDLASSDHPFVDQCTITGGTGHYAGATGFIQESGTFDFANNVGQADYEGKLVLP